MVCILFKKNKVRFSYLVKLDTRLGDFKMSRLFRDDIFSAAALFRKPTPTQNKMAASASMPFWAMDLECEPIHS
jgi:hypothetical protein